MKTIFTLLSSVLLSAAVVAAPADKGEKFKAGSITVTSADRGDIRVIVDGRRFEPNANAIVISGLQSGYHSVKIYRQRNGGMFNIMGGRYEMVYNTSLLTKNRTNTTISIDRFGRTTIFEQKMQGNRRDRDDRDWGRDDRDRDFDFDRDGKYGDYDQHNGYSPAMSDREFRTVLESIDREWLETNKLKSATQVVRTNTLSAAQVKQLVLMFSFESNKLELAKQAYLNTVDKQNYYIINDAFSFNSSKDELNRYIRNIR